MLLVLPSVLILSYRSIRRGNGYSSNRVRCIFLYFCFMVIVVPIRDVISSSDDITTSNTNDNMGVKALSSIPKLSSWTVDQYPIPSVENTICCTTEKNLKLLSYRFCDPNSLIRNHTDIERIESTLSYDRLINYTSSEITKLQPSQLEQQSKDDILPQPAPTFAVQYGVALMTKVSFVTSVTFLLFAA
jgi:hypothetical protein